MRNNYRWGKIVLSAALCVSFLVSAAGCAQGGAGTEQSGGGASGSTGAAAAGGSGSETEYEKVVFRPPVDTPTVIPEEKEETVYVKADAAGNPTEKTVEVILRKITGEDPVEDRSNLTGIKNTEGDEEYIEAGAGRYLWENHGEDIRYEGTTQEPLPLDVHVTYYLEGSEVTADKIAGKTGAVRIRFDYENHTDVPFMVLSSVILSSDVFSDIEVTNGKIMDLGDQKAVIGFAFPGLMENLKLADYEPTEEIDLPEYVEIKARAEEFELDFTATVVSTGLFEEVEEEDLKDLEDMSDDMDELTDASSELTDAAEELAEGGAEFGSYLSQYFKGLSKLSEGTEALDSGLALLSSNISQISEGAEKLNKGLSGLNESLSEIDLSALTSEESRQASEAAQAALQSLSDSSGALGEKMTGIGTALTDLQGVMENLTAYVTLVEELKTAVDDNPAPDLTEKASETAASLNAEAASQAGTVAKEAAESAANELIGEAAANAASATADDARGSIRSSIEASSALDDLGLTDEQKAAVREQLISEITGCIEENTGDIPQANVNIEGLEISLDALLAQTLEEMQADLNEKYGNIVTAREAVPELEIPDLSALSADQIGEITETLGQMEQDFAVLSAYAQGLSSMQDSLKQLSEGLGELKSGVSALSEGSGGLAEGLALFEEALGQTAEGSSQLNTAVSQVASAGGKLGSAYWQLVDGMNAFADGVSEFDEEGIQSLSELAGPEYMDVIRGIRAARDAENEYTNFSGICEGQKGSVRFVIETEEISADD